MAARPDGLLAMGRQLFLHQVTAARLAESAVRDALTEQEIDVEAAALLSSLEFTTELSRFEAMVESIDLDDEIARLAAALVQDAGRAAESVAVTARPHVSYVRMLNLPSCSRCAILAGRVYRYSEGFLRHPGCDCVMIPVTVVSPDFTQDAADLALQGRVTGLSKADHRAIRDGADMGRIVNVRRRAAGLAEAGRVLSRAGKPTPEAIYRQATDRDDAIALLIRHGYLTS